MKELKHRTCPLSPVFVENILVSGWGVGGAMFGSRIPVVKLWEKHRADTVAGRGVHRRGVSALRRRAGRPT